MKKIIGIVVLMFFVLLGSMQDCWAQTRRAAVSFDGSQIAYNVYGKGDTSLVFIHGWSCDSRYWDNQIKAFSKKYKMVTIDLAGHGHSSMSRENYTIPAFAKDVKAVVEKESIEKAILIGHSMGGGVIAEAARLMPQKVISLIGIDTLQNVAELIPQERIDGMTAPFEADFVPAAKGFIASMFPENADQELVSWVSSDMSSAPKRVAMSAFYNYLGLFVSGDIAAIFKDIEVPVVSVNARLWPTDVEANRSVMKSYDVHYIDDVGHFLMMEKPKEFNKVLREVIEGINIK